MQNPKNSIYFSKCFFHNFLSNPISLSFSKKSINKFQEGEPYQCTTANQMEVPSYCLKNKEFTNNDYEILSETSSIRNTPYYNLKIESCSFSNCKTKDSQTTISTGKDYNGGAFYVNSASKVSISETTFEKCSANIGGGALSINQVNDVSLKNSKFSLCFSTLGTNAYSDCLQLSHSYTLFSEGKAFYLIQNKKIVNGLGGAIYSHNSQDTQTTITYSNFTFCSCQVGGSCSYFSNANGLLYQYSIISNNFEENQNSQYSTIVYYSTLQSHDIKIENSLFLNNTDCFASETVPHTDFIMDFNDNYFKLTVSCSQFIIPESTIDYNPLKIQQEIDISVTITRSITSSSRFGIVETSDQKKKYYS